MHKEDIKTYNLSTPLFAKCDKKDGRLLAVYTYLPTEETDFDYNVIKPFRKFTTYTLLNDDSNVTFPLFTMLHEAYPNKQFGRLLYDINKAVTCKGKLKAKIKLATFADKFDSLGLIEVDESDFGTEIIPPEIEERQYKEAIFNTFLKNNVLQCIDDMKKVAQFENSEDSLSSMHTCVDSYGRFIFTNELREYLLRKGVQTWINENFKELGIELNNLEKIKVGSDYACLTITDCDFNVK